MSRYLCWTESDCEFAEQRLLQAILIASDVETIPYKKPKKGKIVIKPYPFVMTIVCYSALFADGSIDSFCFPFQNGKQIESGAPTHIEAIYYTCRRLNASGIPFTGQNFNYDLGWFLRYDMPVANYAYDSMTLFWAKWPELPKRLDFVASILLDDYQYWKAGRKSQDFYVYCDYGMSDTESTLRSTIELIQMAVDDPRMRRNFFYAHMRCIVALSMSVKGMKVNFDTIEKFNVDLTKKAEQSLERLRFLIADENFNPNSPKQKSHLFYDLLGCKKRTDKGKFAKRAGTESTGKAALRAIRNDHPLFRRIAEATLEALEPAKQLSNVVGLQHLNDRFHTSYDGVGAITERLSSRQFVTGHGGNAQNIRKDFREFMEADDDSFLLDIDFSGSDDVFIAFESREPKKIELVRSGRDIHATNALIFFTNWTYDAIIAGKNSNDKKVTDPITGIRQITKKLTHGMSFLMQEETLLMTAGREAIVAAAVEEGIPEAIYWSQSELIRYCAILEKRFRNHYPRLKRSGPDSWYNELKDEGRRTGGITTIFNYFQRYLGDWREDSTLRGYASTAGQANTAGRINLVMNELLFGARMKRFRDGPAPDNDDTGDYRVTESGHGVSLRLQTHDSLTFNIRHTNFNWRQGVDNIFHVMNRPIYAKGETFKVAIEAECSYRWSGPETKKKIFGVSDCESFLKNVSRERLAA